MTQDKCRYGARDCLLAGALLIASTGAASAFCTSGFGPWDVNDLPIPVYLNNNVDDLICPNTDCSSFNEILRTTRIAADEFYDSSGSQLQLRYAGPTDANVGDIIPGAIHIFASPDCSDAGAVAAWGDADGDGKTDFGKVRLCASFLSQPMFWKSHPDFSDGFNLSWQGALAHEIGHTLGFNHPGLCGQNFKTVMGLTTGTSHHGHHIYKDDIDAYQSHYGFRDNTVHFRQSATGADWGTGPTPPGGNLFSDIPYALSRLSACNTSPPSTFVSFPLDATPRLVSVWRYDENGWEDRPSPLFAASNYHTGTACQDEMNVAVAWLGGYDTVSGQQRLFLSTTTDAGDSWNLEVIADGTYETRNAGVSVAYDPQSGHYVVVWRNNFDRITTKVAAPGAQITNYLGYPTSTAYLRASDSVSIACGPVAVVGPENCIVAWPDVGWNRTLHWAQARVDTSGAGPLLVLGSVRSQGYIIYGMPSVSYWSSGEFPWALVFHQGGQTAYSLRKRAGFAANWQDERSLVAEQKIVSPAAASRVGPQTAGDDIFVEWLYAIFTSSSSP